jgi:hypothetical protein
MYFCLVDFFIICNVDVTKKERKEKEKYSESVCVFCIFLCMLLNQKNEFNILMHKYLKDR